MPPRCTCGAELHPNALFCHQCGRPLREEPFRPPPDEADEDTSTGSSLHRPAVGVGFGNAQAVRAAYVPAVMASLLGMIPILSLFCFVWYPAAGFLSSFLYRRRTAADMKPSEGAKLGGMTGLFSFAISLLVSTIAYLFSGGLDLGEAFRDAVAQADQPAEIQQRMSELVENPATLALIMAIGLAVWLVVALGFTAAGGAIAAKVLEKED